ncbi:hypothetical protein ABT224_00945 [Streptomyces sp. NPDC001584]|uniref:hypothetical protein n=1 Tax=Streptomyces sp. NPDC001584 TaxID=3154521 RepID=UPI0033286526
MTTSDTKTGEAEAVSTAAAAAKTQRYGHLELGFTTRMEQPLPQGTARYTPGAFNPLPPDGSGWQRLGTVYCNNHDPVVMVKDHSPQRDLLKAPARFEKAADLWASLAGGGHRLVATVWRPVPPSSDYVAVGVYITPAGTSPSTGDVVCVKKTHSGRTYARRGELSLPVTAHSLFNGLRYNVAPLYPHGDAEEHLILPVGTLSYTAVEDPSPQETTWLLDLPAVVEKFEGPDTPDLENYNSPPERTMITDRAVTVPFYMVADPARTAHWKAENSPFYKILRKRQFRLVRHVDFRGSGAGQISESVEQGVSKETSEEFSVKTGITVGVSVGVEASAKPFGMGASTTVTTSVSTSIEMGYSSRYGVTSMESKTVGVTYNVPAGHAGALWSESHELIPVRADGGMVTSGNLKFDNGSYIGRTHPYSDQRPPEVTDLTAAQDGHATKHLWEIPDEPASQRKTD